MLNNFLLQEAVDKSFNPAPYISELKKMMNTCRLSKFRSKDTCALFYSSFFMNQVEEPLTFDQWRQIYLLLLNDDSFCNLMVLYVALYQPSEYAGMFRVMMNLLDSELATMSTNQTRYLSDAKAFLQFMQMRFDSIGITVKAQTNDNDAIKFLVTINQVLSSDIFYVGDLIQRQMNQYDKDEITHIIQAPLAEDVREIISLMEHADEWKSNWIRQNPSMMNEGIVTAVKEKAKEAHVAAQRASRQFDAFVMKKVKELRTNRQNRKHSEMVGESLRVMHEIKRLIGSAALGGFINPLIGVIAWIGTLAIDKHTDARDRKLLTDQIKDELEIVDEKISQAERNGDDKAKVELIRLRQKLNHEYERINRYRALAKD